MLGGLTGLLATGLCGTPCSMPSGMRAPLFLRGLAQDTSHSKPTRTGRGTRALHLLLRPDETQHKGSQTHHPGGVSTHGRHRPHRLRAHHHRGDQQGLRRRFQLSQYHPKWMWTYSTGWEQHTLIYFWNVHICHRRQSRRSPHLILILGRIFSSTRASQMHLPCTNVFSV